MNRHEQKKATALKILASANILFKQQGYDATSTRQIASHANVGVGTVFSHFKDKHQLTKVLFFNELENKLSSGKCVADEGGMAYFNAQTKQLFQFYGQDRALAKAFLQNALFEIDFFTEQLNDFTSYTASLLTYELPKHSEQQRLTIAKAWIGFYFTELLKGLGDSESDANLWHQVLEDQCQQLLAMCSPHKNNIAL